MNVKLIKSKFRRFFLKLGLAKVRPSDIGDEVFMQKLRKFKKLSHEEFDDRLKNAKNSID